MCSKCLSLHIFIPQSENSYIITFFITGDVNEKINVSNDYSNAINITGTSFCIKRARLLLKLRRHAGWLTCR